jgi:hypothetical protein
MGLSCNFPIADPFPWIGTIKTDHSFVPVYDILDMFWHEVRGNHRTVLTNKNFGYDGNEHRNRKMSGPVKLFPYINTDRQHGKNRIIIDVT